jgi:hypothetical protein
MEKVKIIAADVIRSSSFHVKGTEKSIHVTSVRLAINGKSKVFLHEIKTYE